MEISAEELQFKLFRLHQDGLQIPEYETILQKLGELSRELGEEKKELDYWCERLRELAVCRNALAAAEE